MARARSWGDERSANPLDNPARPYRPLPTVHATQAQDQTGERHVTVPLLLTKQRTKTVTNLNPFSRRVSRTHMVTRINVGSVTQARQMVGANMIVHTNLLTPSWVPHEDATLYRHVQRLHGVGAPSNKPSSPHRRAA